ncbi:MAG: hypothetical protein LBD23_08415 [Oscillospiraceae bacterium]|jgi:hypothetical protein|nr:hypothetical protein [Oscillospiraceae bacterium]
MEIVQDQQKRGKGIPKNPDGRVNKLTLRVDEEFLVELDLLSQVFEMSRSSLLHFLVKKEFNARAEGDARKEEIVVSRDDNEEIIPETIIIDTEAAPIAENNEELILKNPEEIEELKELDVKISENKLITPDSDILKVEKQTENQNKVIKRIGRRENARNILRIHFEEVEKYHNKESFQGVPIDVFIGKFQRYINAEEAGVLKRISNCLETPIEELAFRIVNDYFDTDIIPQDIKGIPLNRFNLK